MIGHIPALALTAAALLGTGAVASECKCRAPGKTFELGETACIATPSGPRLATCGLVLNNTAWTFSSSPCVIGSDSTKLDQTRRLSLFEHDLIRKPVSTFRDHAMSRFDPAAVFEDARTMPRSRDAAGG
jgi:hypothetical protein